MNKELTRWAWEINRSIENCIERMRNNTLTNDYRTDFPMMIVDLAQAVRADPEYGEDPAMQDIAGRLLDCYNALRNENPELMFDKSDEIRQLLTHGEIMFSAESRHRFQAREDGRTYVDFLPLMPREQYLQVVENLKALGARYDPEAKMWYVDKDWQPLEMRKDKAVEHTAAEEKEQEGHPDPSVPQEKAEGNSRYPESGTNLAKSGRDVTPVELRLPYMSPETFKTARAEIKAMGAKFNADKKVWYIERPAGERAIEQIKDCLNRHDEGIYLKLPKAETKEGFNALLVQIKKDGARYNPDKKAWYITKETDRSKFADYLFAEKSSVRDKLSRNKENAGKNGQRRERTMEPRDKDSHERI